MFLPFGRPGSVMRTTLAKPLDRAGLRSGLWSGQAQLPAVESRCGAVAVG